MDSSFSVPDPSDWLQTPVSVLGPVESALRCQVCKDFFNTPMITSCSHTFCSLCIRRCLTNDGRCPSCRAQDQEIKLRPNAIVQDIVESFQAARPVILQLGEAAKATENVGTHVRRKRKLADTDIDGDEGGEKSKSPERRTRVERKKSLSSYDKSSSKVIDNSTDDDYVPDDGLIACPICSARMKEEAVFSHLDVHNGSDDSYKAQAMPTRTSRHFTNNASNTQPSSKTMERLPQLNYSLLKENALRKKLSEIGIPNGGPKALLVRRHIEWVNLVNANCDSTRPRSKRDLLHELDVWDKTQGRQILNNTAGGSSTSSVMNKDFDSAAWAASHDQDFQSLIAKARMKAKPKPEDTNRTEMPSGGGLNGTNANDLPHSTNIVDDLTSKSGEDKVIS